MATFLPITDQGLTPLSTSPDFSFLNSALSKKDLMYEKGYNQVSQQYKALEAEVSDPVVAARRDQYLKNAQSQLKQLSQTDLSLTENVRAAESIFSPLINDDAFLMDSTYTKRNKQELAKMENWMNSSDPKERAKFNPEIYNWIKNDLDSVRNGNGDPNNYKVKGRRAIPYINPLDYVNEKAKEMGFTVKKSLDKGAYIYELEGGDGFRQNYEQFAQQVLTSDPMIQQQYKVLGEARKESVFKSYRQNPAYAGVSDEMIMADYVEKSFIDNRSKYEKMVNSYDQQLQSSKAELQAWINSPATQERISAGDTSVLEEAENRKQKLLGLKTTRDEANSQLTEKFGTGDEVAVRKASYIQDAMKDPDAHFSETYFINDVTRFANVRSTFGKINVIKNDAYFAANSARQAALNTSIDAADKQHDNALDDAEFAHKQNQDALKTTGATSTGTSGSGKPGVTSGELVYTGPSATQITTVNATERLQGRIENSIQRATSSLVQSLDIAESMGVAPEDVAVIKGVFMKGTYDKDAPGGYQLNRAESVAMGRLYGTLFEYAKQSNNSEFTDKLRGLHGKPMSEVDMGELFEIAMTGYQPKTVEELRYMERFNDHKSALEAVKKDAAILTAGKKAISAVVKDNPEYAGIVKQGADGHFDIIGKEDIKQNLREAGDVIVRPRGLDEKILSYVGIDFGGVGQKTRLTEEQIDRIADMYVQGKLTGVRKDSFIPTANFTQIELDGNLYHIEKDNLFPMLDRDYAAKVKKLQEQIPIPQDVLDSVHQGSVVYTAPINTGNDKRELGENILMTVGQINNAPNILASDGTSEFTQVDGEEQQAIRNALNNPDVVAENGIKVIMNSPQNNGGLAVEVSFKPASSEKTEKPYSGKSYLFPINLNARTPDVLKAFGSVHEMNDYMPYKQEGRRYNIAPFTESLGVKAELIPLFPGSDKGRIYLYQKAFDPVTQTYSTDWGAPVKRDFDLSTQTLDEIKEIVYQQFLQPGATQRIIYNNTKSKATGTDLATSVNNLIATIK